MVCELARHVDGRQSSMRPADASSTQMLKWEEDAVDNGGVRAEGEGEGDHRERLPEVPPGAGERGGAHGIPEVEADEDLVL
jgi:hypothetical protein